MKKRRSLRDHFIPHRGNDYTPHALQRAAMLAMLGLVILTFTAANLHSLFWATSEWLVSTILPGVIVELTNEEREDLGVSSLARNSVLDEAARQKAEHMAENQYFSHYSPDGTSPWYWFGQVAYNFAHAGENLAIHFTDSDEVIEAWMNSPSHRQNIVDQKFTQIGVGTARGRYEGFDTVYVVQLFGTPAASASAQEDQVVVTQNTQNTQSDEPSPVLSETIDVVAADEPLEAEEEPEPAPVTESEPEPASASPEPAEPLHATTEEPVTNTELAQASDTEPAIEDVVVDEGGVSLYSETIATSSGLLPAPPTETLAEGAKSTPSLIGSMATRPNIMLQAMYLLLGLFVLVVLLMSILIEVRHQRPVQIAYGLALLLLMSGLFYLHEAVTSGALIA